MKKGTEFHVTVEGIDGEAVGYATVEDATVHIPGVRQGDELLIRVVHLSVHRKEAWAQVIRNKTAATERRSVSCPNAVQAGGDCGGCPAIHLDSPSASKCKKEAVAKSLAKHGIDQPFAFTQSPSQFRYRNRGNFVVSKKTDGTAFLGSYVPRSHRVASMEHCRIYRSPIISVALAVGQLITELQIPVFPEKDSIRYVTVRATTEHKVLLDIIGTSDRLNWIDSLKVGLAAMEEVEGISLGINESQGNAVRIGSSKLLWGQREIVEPIGDISVLLSAGTFSQLNSEVAAMMYQKAASLCMGEDPIEEDSPEGSSEKQAKVIWDLYCGVGGLGMTTAASTTAASTAAASTAAARGNQIEVYGADAVPESIELAQKGAAITKRKGLYQVIDLKEQGPGEWPHPDAILVNPPRKGLDPHVHGLLSSLSSKSPIVYMSCSPETFARDAAVLQQNGWRLGALFAYDMLPQTTHVELLAHFVPFEQIDL